MLTDLHTQHSLAFVPSFQNNGRTRMRNTSRALTFIMLLSLLGLAACQPIQPLPKGGEDPAAAATPVHTETFDGSKYENVWVLAIEEIENEGRSLLRVSYPVTEQDAINARMEAVTQEFIDEYRTTAAEIEAAYQDYKKETGKEAATFVTHYRQHFDVSIANENLVFFDFVRSIHTGGTGNSYVVGFIFDRGTGEELSIADLFVDDSYLERLSALSKEELAELVSKEELASDLDWVEDGTAPTAENFDNIQLRDDGTVVIMFDKYQVAAGVEGVVEVVLPLDSIVDLLKPEVRELLGMESGTTSVGAPSALGNGPPSTLTLASLAPVSYRETVSQRFPDLSLLTYRTAEQAEGRGMEDINCLTEPCVALTFDDGPSFHTERLLDILQEHNVKATFFVLGTQVRIQAETIQRMFEEGHQIGNHTWDHPNLTQLPDDQIQQQLRQTDDLVTQIIGVPTPHMRPPYGAHDERVRAASGLPIIFWSVDPLDWKDRDAATVATRISDAPVGAIILSHDIHKSTVDAVPAIIAALKGRGIQFVTVTKLFEPNGLQPQRVYKSQPAPPSQ